MRSEYPIEQLLRIRFPVLGNEIDTDHGESLYAAVCRLYPELHELEGLSISPIFSCYPLENRLKLTRNSFIYFQVPADYVGKVIQLAGRQLSLRKDIIRLGVPRLEMIRPHKTLYSKLVTIKNATEEDRVVTKVQEQLENLGVTSQCKVVVERRRILRIHGKKVIGWGITIDELSPDDSVIVQVHGIGGRRKYSCGMFVPSFLEVQK
jgi:CRISPR-associated protein Cas6